MASPITLERAAHWRAARSGPEGDLLALVEPRSLPAAQLLREIARELRPELDAHGDTRRIAQLLESAPAAGSSAQRQRNALAARGNVHDVVDHILNETRAV